MSARTATPRQPGHTMRETLPSSATPLSARTGLAMRASLGPWLLLALVACTPAAPGGKPSAGTPNSGGPATVGVASAATVADAQAPAPDLGAFQVATVLLGDALDAEQLVAVPKQVFAPGATIHASVLSTGAHAGLTLTARWRGPDGTPILETAQAIAPTQPLATTFTLRRDQPWPPGDYAFDLLAEGHRLQSVPFTVH